MQTFLPYPSFEHSLSCLDFKRLGKQRLEALQIYKIVSGIAPHSKWRNHPATKMWKNHSQALALYYNLCLEEWIRRKYKNSMKKIEIVDEIEFPWWLGNEEFHASHRSNLLRKNPLFYGKYGWKEPDYLPYMWPKP